MRFKKGELTKEAYKVIIYDLEAMDINFTDSSTKYHYNLLRGNLKDLFGVKEK